MDLQSLKLSAFLNNLQGGSMSQNIGCGKRIKEWRKSKKLKLREVVKLLKVSQGSLSDIENGNSDPSARTIRSFILNTDINILWMLTGQTGDVKRGNVPQKDPPMVITLPKNVKEVLIKRE